MRQQNNKRNSLVKRTVKELRPKTLNFRSGGKSGSRKNNFQNGTSEGDFFGESGERSYKSGPARGSFGRSDAGFGSGSFGESRSGSKSGYSKSSYSKGGSKYNSFKDNGSESRSGYESRTGKKFGNSGGRGESYSFRNNNSRNSYNSDYKNDYRTDYSEKPKQPKENKQNSEPGEYDTSGYMDQKDYPERKIGGYLGEYQLLDCGDGKKLEAFGKLLIIRPCPQALWPKSTSTKTIEIGEMGQKSITELWNLADFEFVRTGQEKGFWWHRKSENLETRKTSFDQNRYPFNEKLPSSWTVSCGGINWRIEPNQFGNIGIFSEHFEYVPSLLNFFDKNEKVLNLFTYSGSNCVLLAKNGFKITAVDSSKSAISAFSENLQNNGVPKEGSCRLILEDAYKFVAREVRREAKYGSIMIDAPSYGRGTKGEIFNIEESLKELIESCQELMTQTSKVVITLHSPRFTPKMLEIFIKSLFPNKKVLVEEIVQNCVSGNQLTSGMLVCVE